ncbi:uncharacterized protein [Rutidosis leptorrhynchoides]|uniref:uncharacterized protein n=1 Tax=Rutidosis leptorrhynchoides TaxID=125765 RepID=UPI003A991AF5
MFLRSPTYSFSPYDIVQSRYLHKHRLHVQSMAKQSGEKQQVSNNEKLAIAGGLISNPVIAWSLYTLKTTGYGLPSGPGGSIGALEGVSYLVVMGIVGWSLYTKSTTGSGLPNGPFGLLGVVEGLSYLSVVAILVVFGLQFFQKSFAYGLVPDSVIDSLIDIDQFLCYSYSIVCV